MKKSNKLLVYLLLLMLIFILLPQLIQAQPGSVDPGCGSDDPCPIDGGLTALIAIGVGYGIKKIRDNKKPESIS